MQMNYTQALEIEATVERVFSILSNIPKLHTVLAVLGPAKDYHGASLEVGDTWLLPQMHGSDPYDIEYEVTAMTTNSLLEWVGASPYGTCSYTWRIDPNSTTSKLTLEVCSELPEGVDGTTAQTFVANSKEWTWSNLHRIKERAES